MTTNRSGTALITGATAGLGAGFAQALAARGHDLVLVARTQSRLEQSATELARRHGVAVSTIAADLAQREGVEQVAARLRADGADAPPIGTLVNNAGFGLRHGFLDNDVEDEQRLIDVLVTAVMRLSHAALPGMLARGSGRLINVSSVAGWVTGGTYSAAKAWVTTFTEGLAPDLRGTGVAATAVCPGFTATEFHDRAQMNMQGVPSWLWLSVDQVVAEALRDSDRGRLISVAGRQYDALSTAAQYLPRPLVRRITAGRR